MQGLLRKVQEEQEKGIKRDNSQIANLDDDIRTMVAQGALRIKIFKED